MVKSNAGRTLFSNLLFALCCLSLPLFVFAWYWLVTLPDISTLAKKNPTTTALIDLRIDAAQSKERTRRPARRWVPLSRISPHLKRAVIVAEDARFYSHEGFDWEGMRFALMRNWKKGEMYRGGSTITQQLAKNLYLSPKKNILRKLREAMIARELERHLSKGRILELYLNIVEWGHHVYGAEAAARHHFHKSAAWLTREESALLAAMLPSPRQYDPIRMTRFLEKRQQWILKHMK